LYERNYIEFIAVFVKPGSPASIVPAEVGISDEVLHDSAWEEIPEHELASAQWHKWILRRLFDFWYVSYDAAVRSGTVHIMAKNALRRIAAA
jgi:hypothetical protein